MNSRRAVGAFAFVAAVVAATAVAAFASSAPVQTRSATAVTLDRVKTSAGPLTVGTLFTPTSGWQNIPGISMTMTVPTGQQALFLARLSAHTLCQYRGNCDVRFTVNGDLMQPDDGLIDAASGWYGADLFASGNDDAWQQHIHTMIKGAGPYPAGTYTIRAQAYLADPGDTEGGVMELRDWQFEVERARAG